MTPASRSAPSLIVLHTVRVNGRVSTTRLVELTDLPVDAIEGELQVAVAADWLRHHDGVITGWSLTPTGRQRHLELLADERDGGDWETEIRAGYDDLMGLNEWFKALCTEWQLHDQPPSCIDRLVAQHPQVDAITRRLADTRSRFNPYTRRFSTALERLQAGDLNAFTTPLTDSYHDVWMQLHEDLLLTLGQERTASDGS